jgi:hypothetical protein
MMTTQPGSLPRWQKEYGETIALSARWRTKALDTD